MKQIIISIAFLLFLNSLFAQSIKTRIIPSVDTVTMKNGIVYYPIGIVYNGVFTDLYFKNNPEVTYRVFSDSIKSKNVRSFSTNYSDYNVRLKKMNAANPLIIGFPILAAGIALNVVSNLMPKNTLQEIKKSQSYNIIGGVLTPIGAVFISTGIIKISLNKRQQAPIFLRKK